MPVSILMDKANSGLLDNHKPLMQHGPLGSRDETKKIGTEVKGNAVNLGILEGLMGYQLRRAQLSLYHSFNKHLEHANITPGQIGLLVKIKNNAGISQTALARANGIERSTLGEIIDRFEKRQFVERRKHATDRRAYALHLSVQGDAFLKEVVPQLLQQEDDFLRQWSENDRQTLLRLLTKLADTVP